MKTENMKLLDLQTGKYLELGKDWLYGGEIIEVKMDTITQYIDKTPTTIMPREKFNLMQTKFDSFLRHYQLESNYGSISNLNNEIYIKDKHSDNILLKVTNSTTSNRALLTLANFCFTNFRYNYVIEKKPQRIIKYKARLHKSEPQGILKTLCDKTGALVYGGRYVLNPNYATIRAVIVNGGEHGFIYRLESLHQCKITNKCISLDEYLKYRPELVYAEKGYTEWYIYGNPFEEYSKQLRKEENKFDELMENLK